MIETERLVLRRVKVEDLEKIYKIHNSEFVLKYNCLKKCTKDEVIKIVERDKELDDIWAIALKETDEYIGQIDIDKDSLRYGTSTREISYFLDESYIRRGIMYEAMNAIIHHIFTQTDCVGITARCFVDNVASGKLLEKLGFTCEGILKNCVLAYGDIIYDDSVHYLEKANITKFY